MWMTPLNVVGDVEEEEEDEEDEEEDEEDEEEEEGGEEEEDIAVAEAMMHSAVSETAHRPNKFSQVSILCSKTKSLNR